MIPRKLASAYQAAGSYRELARRLRINPRYVYEYIAKGIEPTNPEIRAKLFLPRKPRQPRRPRPTPEWKKPIRRGIRKMKKATNDALQICSKPNPGA
jgi:hypothetical protein